MTDSARKARDARQRRLDKGRNQEAAAKRVTKGLQAMIEMPLLEAIAQAGGAARPRDLYGEVAQRLNLDPDVRKEKRGCADQEYAIFDQQVRWTRQTLVGEGLIAGERGIWELTDKGRDKLTRVTRGKVVLIYRLDDGLAFLAHAEEAAGAIEKESLSLVLTSPPYPVVGREYGRFSVPEWLEWMSGLVGMWRDLLRPDGTLAVNLMDVHVPGTPMLSPYVERFSLDAIDNHGLHLAGRMPWHSPNKLGNLEWAVKRRVALRNTVEHVLLFSKTPTPSWDTRRLPSDPYAERSASARKHDARRGHEQRPGGYDINPEAFARDGEGRIPSNLIISGGVGGGGTYASRCREEGLGLHPARFPEEIPRRIIQLATAPGQVVYDPMAGSNTTGKVALDLGRRFISSEPVLEYAQGSALRFSHRPDFRAFPIPA
ncbi:site-specific DNA-methyltransferase [Croceicoccus gelatinilyticus]|uniref:site-specific DNA-methyltransferase n=1 Tax=Croceicoccus gelatinilyticus TaxID=2835536 RepID=UPI001BCA9D05|nr:site-specific DNA-methyltransferase [Croceicoccus gelatinilyticus]MBS7671742.1 site-specific DNA-methyltransferase [Croceicoccus gelatinilyticus]